MQNNGNDELGKTKEMPGVSAVKPADDEGAAQDVHQDQQSMFDNDEAFSEAIVAYTEPVEVNPEEEEDTTDVGGDTAEFTFSSKEEETEIGHDELTVGDIEGSARAYYNATHSGSIEDKVSELRSLADGGFDETETDSETEEESREEKKKDKKKKDKKKKDKKKRGVISDDDMILLSGGTLDSDEDEEQEEETEEETYADTEEPAESEEYPTEEFEAVDDAEESDVEDDEDDDDEDDPFIKVFGKPKSERKTFESVFSNDEPDVEYTSREEDGKILSELRSKAMKATASVIFTVIAAVLCFYFEAAAGTGLAHPSFFEPGKFGVTYAMSMLQLMFVCAVFNLDGMKRAFLGLRPSRPSAEALAATAFSVCTLHTILSCIFAYNSAELKTFCSVGCISLVLLSVNSFVKAYTSLIAFCVAASKNPKFACGAKSRDSEEGQAFKRYLEKYTTIITVGRGSFVSGFFRKFHAVPAVARGTFKHIVALFAASVAAGVLCGVLTKSVYGGICAFTTCCLASIPANLLISTALPFLVASLKAKKSSSAYIGEAACDAYETAGIISFDDIEVFPPKSVKVNSIKTYEDNRIDKVILYMARIFDKLKGPLSFVFANSIHNFEGADVEATVVEQFGDGISAKIDGKDVLVGTDDFMKLYDIESPLDNIDETFLQSLGSIMYMAIDGKLAAKFYIKYTVNRNFEAVLHAFYDAGICVGIKTLDPCVTTELVAANLKGTNYPISVIKCQSPAESMATVSESVDSTVISVSGVHSFLENFLRLDNLRNVYKINKILGIVCSVVGFVLAALLNLLGASAGVGILFIIVFQLIWCIPTVIFSATSK